MMADDTQLTEIYLYDKSEVLSLDTSAILLPNNYDHSEVDMGDIDALSEDLVENGQHQPCVVRPHPSEINKYELVIGERRLRAAIKAGVNLSVIVRNLTDVEVIQARSEANYLPLMSGRTHQH